MQSYHPFFMGPDYIGPAVDHFQEISAQYPEVSETLVFIALSRLPYMLLYIQQAHEQYVLEKGTL